MEKMRIIFKNWLIKAHITLGCCKYNSKRNGVELAKCMETKKDPCIKVINEDQGRNNANMTFKIVDIPSNTYGLPVCSISIYEITQIKNFTSSKFLLRAAIVRGMIQY